MRLVPLFLVLLATPVLAADPSIVYLVRHAEKADGDDPSLTKAGTDRALVLSRLLSDVKLMDVHSTDTQRTRSTALPAATTQKYKVALYDPNDPSKLLRRMRKPGAHLVVGHSNTTPALVTALGGDPHGDIHHDEYDRLYVVVVTDGGEVTTQLLRYGAASTLPE